MMLSSFRFARPVSLLSGVVLLCSCKPETAATAKKSTTKSAAEEKKAGPSPEDIRIGRDVMALSDVVAELRSGVSRAQVLEDVRRRHIATTLVEANELELAANGAGRELIAALRDVKNLPTPAQEEVYVQSVAEQQRALARSKAATAAPVRR